MQCPGAFSTQISDSWAVRWTICFRKVKTNITISYKVLHIPHIEKYNMFYFVCYRQVLRTHNCWSFGQYDLFIDGVGSVQSEVSFCSRIWTGLRIQIGRRLFGSVSPRAFSDLTVSDSPRVHSERVSIFIKFIYSYQDRWESHVPFCVLNPWPTILQYMISPVLPLEIKPPC